MTWHVEVGGRTRRVDVRGADVLLDGRLVHADAARLGDVVSLIVGLSGAAGGDAGSGRSFEVVVSERGSGDLLVSVNGRVIATRASSAASRTRERVIRATGRHNQAIASGPHRVVAPMPGRVARVLVRIGDVVAARQGLVVVEAMKMENELRSPSAGTVTEVRAIEGSRVESQALLVVVE